MWIFSHRSFGNKLARGFTLIELLTVLTIVVIITALLLLRQSQFNSSTLLRSLAYNIALSMRQAQVYGTTVFGSSTPLSANCTAGVYSAGSCFAPAYGLYFSGGTPTSYTLFGDANGNGRYDAGEGIQTFTIRSGYSITRFCAGRIVGGTQDCWQSTTPTIQNMSVVFKRPNPDACVSTDTNPTVCAAGVSAIYASSSVRVTSQTGDVRTVVVTQPGQIAVCPLNQAC